MPKYSISTLFQMFMLQNNLTIVSSHKRDSGAYMEFFAPESDADCRKIAEEIAEEFNSIFFDAIEFVYRLEDIFKKHNGSKRINRAVSADKDKQKK